MKRFYALLLTTVLLTAEEWEEEIPSRHSRRIECTLRPIKRRPPPPQAVVGEVTSANWGGYVAVTHGADPVAHAVTAVSGAWTVPTLHATADDASCALWVGIDGYGSDSVEQLGTKQDWSGGLSGSQSNYAWFEMYPAGSFNIEGFPANPGDNMRASVQYVGDDVFKLIIENTTHGVHYEVPSSYTHGVVERLSAEWVAEAPYDGEILPLADFGSVTFTQCKATINGHSAPIVNKHWKHVEIEMEAGDIAKAVPSAVYRKGKDFMVVWEHE